MKYKNKFNFATLVITVGLGVGLLISGCGDSGSTTPNPLNGSDTPTPPTPEPPISDTYKVTFQYNSLAKNLGRTAVTSDIVSVKYVFYSEKDQQKVINKITDAQELKHEASASEPNITIDNLDDTVTSVTAAYYNENDELLGVGYDAIDWQGQKTVTITDPDLYTLTDNDQLSLIADKYVVKPSEGVALNLTLTSSTSPVKTYDLTPFATFSQLNDIDNPSTVVLTANESAANGQFKVAAYGKVKPVASIGSKIKQAAEEIIYVTDQTPESIELRPANSKISFGSDTKTDVDKSFFLTYIPDPSKALGEKEIVTVQCCDWKTGNTPLGEVTFALGEVPMQAIATYTKEPDKGPQPPQSDIIKDVELTTAFSGEGVATYYGLDSNNGTLVASALGNVYSEWETYTVTAKYGQLSDTNTVFMGGFLSSDFNFCKKDDSGNLVAFNPARMLHAPGEYKFYLAGTMKFENLTVGSKILSFAKEPFFLREDFVGKYDYPECYIINSTSSECTGEGESFQRAADGSNEYIVTLIDLGGKHATHTLYTEEFANPGVYVTGLNITTSIDQLDLLSIETKL